MAFKLKKTPELIKVVKELRGAVKAHGKQADIIESHLKYSKAERGMPKKLIGDQDKLPEELKAKIEAAPETPLAKKSGTNVSWRYGGKTYHGTLIPSKETSTHRYARTHNGKIKSLPKNK